MTQLAQIAQIFAVILTLTITTGLAGAGPVEYPEDIAARLQVRYDTMQSLNFNFFQDIQGEMTGRPRQGSGRAVFLKNDGKARMRWDYTSPDQQVLISDGVVFSMYFANLKQLIISPAEQLDADLTYSFFTGKGVLKRDFHIRPANEDEQSTNEDEFKVIKLIPKTPQSQVQDIHLYVTHTSLIRRIKIRDHFGTITVLNLSDIEVDTVMNGKNQEEIDAIFTFVPPPGTEIIR
ncbi:MAG: outer membrane lipoprotein carrier protein LolA [Proteobacteria bacterium]|nr:outer membrane lipoprotein carrier protein LolA [Pseudomonadota bacterium]